MSGFPLVFQHYTTLPYTCDAKVHGKPVCRQQVSHNARGPV